MSEDRQIEELTADIANMPNSVDCIVAEAEYLYAKGYRKQSEWISVDERLPESDARVLVYMHENRMSYTRIDTDRVVQGKWVRWESCVTHWMPLPEPPKGE